MPFLWKFHNWLYQVLLGKQGRECRMSELHHNKVALSPGQSLKHEKQETNQTLTASIPRGTKKK